jgi:mitochondrial fission protein ELM1
MGVTAQVTPRPLVVWRLLDGKPGHENQSLGLAQALAELPPVEIHDVPVGPAWRAWLEWLSGQCSIGNGLPAPDLLIGAGHRTHPWLLAGRRSRGGRTVVLMRPSLPASCFDLVVAPAHDRLAPGPGVLVTRGVLNAVRHGEPDESRPGLILIGGPSDHYGWDETQLLEQLQLILQHERRPWCLTTSRRTPDSTLRALQALPRTYLQILPWQDTPPGWLRETLPGTPQVWITEDSVSMVYEALTAGAACGLLDVPSLKAGRVQYGVAELLREGAVVSFADWAAGRPLLPPEEPYDEAMRCARWIRQTWLAD